MFWLIDKKKKIDHVFYLGVYDCKNYNRKKSFLDGKFSKNYVPVINISVMSGLVSCSTTQYSDSASGDIFSVVLLLYVPSQQLWSWWDGQFT